MIKKLIICLFILFVIISCKKSNSSSSSQSYLITNIGGTYKGGTLSWNNLGNQGSDPNFSFVVSYLDSVTCSVTINTTAPLSLKTFVLPLKSKSVTPIATQQGSGVYGFQSFDQSTTLNVYLTETPTVFNGNGVFSYNNNSTNFQCSGTGTR